MRVYHRIVIDIATGRVLEADSFEYKGQVARAKGSSSTTNTALPKWLQPYSERFIGAYQGQVFDENGNIRPRPEGLDQEVAGFNPLQQQGMSMIEMMTNPAQDLSNQAAYQNALSLSGGYLTPSSNPYINATYNAAARQVTDNYQNAVAPGIMAAAQKSGNFGGSAMDEALAYSRYGLGENLNNLATDIYGGNYQRERDRQMQAMGMSPQMMQQLYAPGQSLLGLGSMQQGQTQQELDTDYMNALSETQFPFELLSGFGGALGQAGMGSGTSTVKSSGGGLMGTVICTALHDFGLMDDETYAADCQFGASLSPEVIRGYHRWAIPVAKAMRKSFLLTALIEPIALSWAKTMRAKIEGKPENETWLGRQLLRFGVPLCRRLGSHSEVVVGLLQ